MYEKNSFQLQHYAPCVFFLGLLHPPILEVERLFLCCWASNEDGAHYLEPKNRRKRNNYLDIDILDYIICHIPRPCGFVFLSFSLAVCSKSVAGGRMCGAPRVWNLAGGQKWCMNPYRA